MYTAILIMLVMFTIVLKIVFSKIARQMDDTCCMNCKCMVENKKTAKCSCATCTCGQLKK